MGIEQHCRSSRKGLLTQTVEPASSIACVTNLPNRAASAKRMTGPSKTLPSAWGRKEKISPRVRAKTVPVLPTAEAATARKKEPPQRLMTWVAASNESEYWQTDQSFE